MPLPNFRPSVKVNVTGDLNFNSTSPLTPPNNDQPATLRTLASSGHPLSPPNTQGSFGRPGFDGGFAQNPGQAVPRCSRPVFLKMSIWNATGGEAHHRFLRGSTGLELYGSTGWATNPVLSLAAAISLVIATSSCSRRRRRELEVRHPRPSGRLLSSPEASTIPHPKRTHHQAA
jgi:hypothetical protein